MTVVRPPARFGQVVMDGNQITSFKEKPKHGEGWINGAFFVLEPEVCEYIDGPDILFEKEPLERLAAAGQLMAYKHEGFWQCMDALRDKLVLEDIWAKGNAPWATWRMSDASTFDGTPRLRGIPSGPAVVGGRA